MERLARAENGRSQKWLPETSLECDCHGRGPEYAQFAEKLPARAKAAGADMSPWAYVDGSPADNGRPHAWHLSCGGIAQIKGMHRSLPAQRFRRDCHGIRHHGCRCTAWHWPGMVLTAVTKLCWQDGADNYWKCVTRWLAAPGFMPGGVVSSETATADEPFLRETPK